MQETQRSRSSRPLGTELVRKALEEDWVQVFLQPIVDLNKREVFAYEALVRIREGETALTPGQFMPAIEETGLVEELDARVLEKGLACLQRPEMTGLKVFFNISPRTLQNWERMGRALGQLAVRGIPASRVVFEITERQALSRLSELQTLTQGLRAQGLAFALDDFGSGFSSFLYLKNLVVDYVKIEGDFIRRMANDKRDRLIVEHIQTISRELGAHAIAESVEDAETHALLLQMGVNYGQGYHYGCWSGSRVVK